MMYQLNMMDAQIIAQNLIAGADSFPLMAAPFFLLAGEVMNSGGLSKRIVNVALTLVGHVRGGLGYVVILASCILAALSGSAVADAAALSALLFPMMVKAGHNPAKSAGLIAAGGIIGPIIPPSIGFIVFGVAAGLSISKLFLAGIVPGILIGAGLAIAWWWEARKEHIVPPPKASSQGRRPRGDRRPWALALPGIIIFGLKFGIFTPTEAGVVCAVYALFVAICIYKELKWKDVFGVFVTAAETTAIVMFLVAAALVSAWLITVAELPGQVTALLKPFMGSPLLLLLAMQVLVVIVGTALDMTPTILILTPVLMPIVKAAGIDPIYFGVLFIINNSIGLITPPVGTVLNTVCGVAKIRHGRHHQGRVAVHDRATDRACVADLLSDPGHGAGEVVQQLRRADFGNAVRRGTAGRRVNVVSLREGREMKKSMKLVLAVACGALVMAGATQAQVREQTFRWTTANPAGHPIPVGGQKFADLVAAKSGGKMQVKVFPGGVLGGDVQVLSAVQGGTIDMASMNSGILQGQIKEYAIVDFPFLFDNAKEADAILDGPIGKQLADKLPGEGPRPPRLLRPRLPQRHRQQARDQDGGRHLGPQDPRDPVADLRRHVQRARRQLGADGVHRGLHGAGAEGDRRAGKPVHRDRGEQVPGSAEVPRRHAPHVQPAVDVRQQEDLGPPEQGRAADPARRREGVAAVYQRKFSRDAQDASLANLKKTMEYTELPPAEIAKVRTKLKPVIDKYSAAVGADFAKQVYTEIDKVRAQVDAVDDLGPAARRRPALRGLAAI